MPEANPYRPGAATAPVTMVGRDVHLAELDASIADAGTYIGEPRVFYGPPGIGKTVLLNTMVTRARAHRWAATRLEADPHTGLVVAIAARTEQLLDTFDRAGRKAWGRVRNVVDEITAGAGPAKITVKLAKPDTDHRGHLLVPVVDQLGRAAQARGVGVALMVDEIHDASPADVRALTAAIQHVNSEQLPVLVTTAGLAAARQQLATGTSYSERFAFRRLDRLNIVGTALALTGPARHDGATIHGDALVRLVEISEGYPYFIQLYGRCAWAAAGGATEINPRHVAAGELLANDALDRGLHGVVWDKTPPTDKQYLASLAATLAGSGNDCAPVDDVARTFNASPSAESAARTRLVARGLIGHHPSGLGFALPGLGRYAAYRALRDELELPSATRDALLATPAMREQLAQRRQRVDPTMARRAAVGLDL